MFQQRRQVRNAECLSKWIVLLKKMIASDTTRCNFGFFILFILGISVTSKQHQKVTLSIEYMLIYSYSLTYAGSSKIMLK